MMQVQHDEEQPPVIVHQLEKCYAKPRFVLTVGSRLFEFKYVCSQFLSDLAFWNSRVISVFKVQRH